MILEFMRPVKKLESPIVPKEIIKTSGEDLEKGGRQGNLENLQELSLGYEDLGDDTYGLVFPKLKTYSPTPGWDNMVYVAKKEGLVKSISDLHPEQLSNVMQMGSELFDVYSETAERSPLSQKFLSINYHADPLPAENAFGNRKLFAQTLADLHVHFGAYSEKDVDKLEHIQRKQRQPQEVDDETLTRISRTEYDDVNDPMSHLVERLSAVPAIEEQITKDLKVINLDPEEKQYIGINFSVGDKQLLRSPEFAQDLITLHKKHGTALQGYRRYNSRFRKSRCNRNASTSIGRRTRTNDSHLHGKTRYRPPNSG